MSLKATIRIQKPDDIEVTMTLTMPLREWERLRQQLPTSHPSWKLSEVISELVMQAKVQFTSEHEVTS